MIFPSYHRLSLNFFLTLVPFLYRDIIRVCDRVCGPVVAVGIVAGVCCSVLVVAFSGLTSLFFGSPEAIGGASSFWILWIGWYCPRDVGMGWVRAFLRSWRAIVSWSPGVASGSGQQCG